MTEKLTEKELESAAHQSAYSLLIKTIEFQPGLLSGGGIHGSGGQAVGQFVNNLYDQLLELARKNLKGEGV